MKLTASFPLTAAVNPESRRIVGLIVPFNEQGTPGIGGFGVVAEVQPGGFTWDAENMPLLRSTHHTEPIGRAVTLDAANQGIIGSFTVAKTRHADDALVLAAEGLQAGLSVEAEVPDDFQPDADGVFRLTADNPGKITAVALVESPAFTSARVHEVAASRKETTPMTEQVTPAEQAPSSDLTAETIANAVTAGVTAAMETVLDTVTHEQVVAAAQTLPERLTAATSVTREPFPYGHPGAEGQSLFKDLLHASKDTEAARRADKANSMLASMSSAIRGNQLFAANEPVVRSTLIVPNQYDVNRYVEELVNPRVIADHVPGIAISAPNPIVIPAFSSSFADGGSGEPVVASTEGSNPAQAELTTTSITATPIWYNGLYDVARAAVDAAAPGTDGLIMKTLINSYNETTEAAAVTAILANGTAGTDVTSNADTTGVEPQSAQKAIRLEMAKMNVGLKVAPKAVLFASDVYQVAVGADNAAGSGPLYPFLADRFQAVNQAAGIDADMALAVYGRPGYLAHALTATKFVVVNWSGVIRYESPLRQFTLEEVIAPAGVRFAVGGYFVQRTLQAQAVRYFAQA